MAKGNDGNLLQHQIETGLAMRLVGMGDGRLHLALTHGMAPFEACEAPRNGVRHGRLDDVLGAAHLGAPENLAPLSRAYRFCDASRRRYPNSGELVASLIGRENLQGCIAEVDDRKSRELSAAWAGTSVRIAHASWRAEAGPRGGLRCPHGLDRPWLFSMDPLSWKDDLLSDADDAQLRYDDMKLVETVLEEYVASGRPGAVSIFVYKVPAGEQAPFWLAMAGLARSLGVRARAYTGPYDVAHRNLAAVFAAWSPSA